VYFEGGERDRKEAGYCRGKKTRVKKWIVQPDDNLSNKRKERDSGEGQGLQSKKSWGGRKKSVLTARSAGPASKKKKSVAELVWCSVRQRGGEGLHASVIVTTQIDRCEPPLQQSGGSEERDQQFQET